MGMEAVLGGAVLLIIVLALCNPRLRRDMKSGHSSMDDVLQQGREDLKAAFRNRKNRDRRE